MYPPHRVPYIRFQNQPPEDLTWKVQYTCQGEAYNVLETIHTESVGRHRGHVILSWHTHAVQLHFLRFYSKRWPSMPTDLNPTHTVNSNSFAVLSDRILSKLHSSTMDPNPVMRWSGDTEFFCTLQTCIIQADYDVTSQPDGIVFHLVSLRLSHFQTPGWCTLL